MALIYHLRNGNIYQFIPIGNNGEGLAGILCYNDKYLRNLTSKLEIMNKKPLVIFLHIRKTAGSSFRYAIQRNFAPDEYLFAKVSARLPRETFCEFWRKVLAEYDAKSLDRLLIIGGHDVYYGIHELFPDRAPLYVTIFRRPDKLAVSLYNFICGIQNNMRETPRKRRWLEMICGADSKPRSFEEALGSTALFDNFLFRSFYDFVFDAMTAEFPDSLQKNINVSETMKAFSAVLHEFHFVGANDDISMDLNYLCGLLGIKKRFRRSNVSRKFQSLAALSQPARKLLADKTSLDQELFEIARKSCNNLNNAKYFKIAHESLISEKKYLLHHPLDYCFSEGADYFFRTFLPSILFRLSANLKKRCKSYDKLLAAMRKRRKF